MPLFEPPIDPALLVRAAAAGMDISSALNDINAALPHYRFNVMAQKAVECARRSRHWVGALLSALEKRDAEGLALLRSSSEIEVLKAVQQVKERQIEETTRAKEGLEKSRDVVKIRHDYYQNIAFMNESEIAHLTLVAVGMLMQLGQVDRRDSSWDAASYPGEQGGRSDHCRSDLRRFQRCQWGFRPSPLRWVQQSRCQQFGGAQWLPPSAAISAALRIGRCKSRRPRKNWSR